MRFRTLALALALSVGATGLAQASKKTTVVGAERPKAKKAKKAKKTKPAKHAKTAKASKVKAPKDKKVKRASR